jgi:hypothetical protein
VAPAALPDTAAPGEVARGFDPGSILAMQRSAGNAAVSGLLPNAAQADHSLARALARTAQERTGREPQPSPARLLRSRLRALARVATSGGDWSTDKHDATKDLDSAGNKAPAADGWRGVDIDLKFKPNATVDAELIGLTQTAQSIEGGAPLILPAAASRAISAGDAKPLNTGAGETDESAHIDQSSTNPNPLYAVENAKSTKLTDPARAFFGQHGFHFKNGAGAVQKQDGILKDTPRMPHGDKNSRQIFETTALATKGAQAGTYYGSVRWGWRTDAAGVYTKLPLEKVAEGIPSSTFLKSAEIWNTGKAAGGAANVKLPVPEVKKTSGPVTLLLPVPMAPLSLLVGTRLHVLTTMAMPATTVQVRVIDGPNNGTSGEVDSSEWGNLVGERT